MTVFLERVDSAPLSNSQFTFEFMQWLGVLVDQLNEQLGDIQTNLNQNLAQSHTASEISSLASAGLPDGVILYDTTNHVYVGQENGTLRKFTTAAYP